MEERIRDPMEMLTKTRWEATHLTKACDVQHCLFVFDMISQNIDNVE